jgi:hypothetical protein
MSDRPEYRGEAQEDAKGMSKEQTLKESYAAEQAKLAEALRVKVAAASAACGRCMFFDCDPDDHIGFGFRGFCFYDPVHVAKYPLHWCRHFTEKTELKAPL